MEEMAYLDNSATTRTDDQVVRVMVEVMNNIYGNPASLHGLGAKAERLVTQAREATARTLGVSPGEIVFTSGGTEGNNTAIKGVAFQYRDRGRHLITTRVEHPSVYGVCKQLEEWGWRVTYLPVDAYGRVRPEDVETAITDETVLVSVMHVNNEVGTIQPIAEIGALLKRHPKVLFHVDAVQSFGKMEVRPKEWGVDLMTLSGHKFHGPKGVGCLYVREGVSLAPLLTGGGQEGGLRSGTHNVPGIAGFAKAALLAKERQPEAVRRWSRWKADLIEQVMSRVEGVRVNGDPSHEGGAPHIVSFSFPGLRSEVIVHALEEENVFVSSKSACSSKGEKPSRILLAMGLDPTAAVGSIRISMGYHTTEEEVERCARALCQVIPRLQKIMT
ncbi:cysteine desulfurase [Polycladomyces sp. WAk]|uniref:Cysteine desulfurase n=2 Tax=Polycladomyces zharkentensis TaxID=2807616 RepID=A0ABS2WG01_9BACL|nr:cysteine desulfurase family protein [Polycladomyces sp. WAk]MBN2908457.1 cysteine desulfurase [Polycladomyces sp. WAk]